jgi:type VI secretion system secreted protein VgrG
MEVSTPLGKDVLLLEGFSGHEGLSQLFRFQLDLLADNRQVKDVAFDKLLGQPVTVRLGLSAGKQRFFNGICSRFSQGESGLEFTTYRMEVVPRFWLWTRRAQSRIFQHKNVPDILKEVLQGLDVSFDLLGTFHPRDFCVQYRETDFNFACRLMEEEGIYYFFKHTDGGHPMVVANTPQSHPDLPGGSRVPYKRLTQASVEEEDIIYDWSKAQEVTSGKYTLWDHCFELPHKHLEAEKLIGDGLQVGKAPHHLQVADNSKLEIYDWPGEYAQRFDAIDKGGGEHLAELQKIFEDNERTVSIRMQQEAATAISVQGASTCRQLVPGYKFTLAPEPTDSLLGLLNAGGAYVLTAVSHSARGGDYRSGGGGFEYHNSFTCLPAALPFRPQRTTPKPVVQGSQTAVVVGPPGEEIFTDKYGRVKVQFHWDRQGKRDADSSCWIRVATLWAGKNWGIVHIPRVGHEVVVDFLEGDPDQPIIVGSVFNAEMLPPYGLPANRTQSGIKSRSSLKGTPDNFNEIRFEDKKGKEQLYIHAEKNQDNVVEADDTLSVGHDRTKTIGHDEKTDVKHDRTETVGNDENLTIDNNRTEHVNRGHETITIHTGNRTVNVDTGHDTTNVKTRNHQVNVDTGHATLKVLSGNRDVLVNSGNYQLTAATKQVVIKAGDKIIEIGNNEVNISGGSKVIVSAGTELTLGVGPSTITLKPDGITIGGPKITSAAAGEHTVTGALVKIN